MRIAPPAADQDKKTSFLAKKTRKPFYLTSIALQHPTRTYRACNFGTFSLSSRVN